MIRRDGFTLIELLVVVSIIALLASMLMPVIGLVRDGAKRISCGANMRQVGLGMVGYATDNEGWLPPACGYVPTAFFTEPSWDIMASSYFTDPRVLACPADRISPLSFLENFDGKLWYDYRRSYTVPGLATGAPIANRAQVVMWFDASAPLGARGGSCALANISESANTVLLAERIHPANFFGSTSCATTSVPTSLAHGHRGTKHQVLFADNHIDSVMLTQTYGTGSAGQIVSVAKGMWTITAGD
jgi:prepilin-type N-terminal cleavage/methylation domain-containing protein